MTTLQTLPKITGILPKNAEFLGSKKKNLCLLADICVWYFIIFSNVNFREI